MTTALTIDQVRTPESAAVWVKTLLDAAVALGLPTTSWRVGDPERVILTAMGYVSQGWDATTSKIAQGAFLDWAATGSVTYEFPDGTSLVAPVSPDPSTDANPNGLPTFLDALGEQNFDELRLRLSSAGGPMAIVNTSASTYGPFDAGGFHVACPANAAGYTNTASLTIAPSALFGTAITAAASSGGLILLTFSGAHGRTTGDAVWIAGVLGTTEANGAWYVTVTGASTLTLDGSTFANAWTSGGTGRLPTVATFTADVGGSASNSVDSTGALALHTVTTAVTSQIGVSVDNLTTFEGSDTESNTAYAARCKLKLQAITTNGAQGAYEYYALSATEFAPLLSTPLAVSTRITKALVVGDKLTGHTLVFVANASGAPSDDDLAAVDGVVQAYATPVSHTTETLKATEVTVAAVFEVYLPAAYATDDNNAAMVAACQAYVRDLDIGGLSDPGLDFTNVLPIADIIGATVFEVAAARGFPVTNATATLNGSAANVSLPVSGSVASVAKLSPATPTVNFNPT
jgi:hypothetical protein